MLALAATPLAAQAHVDLRIIGESNPVKVHVAVTTEDGTPIGDLDTGAFQLFEDGNAQAITSVTKPGTTALAVVFVMDYSRSMYDIGAVVAMQEAVATLIQKFDADDQAAIIKFRGNSVVAQSMTSDKDALLTAVPVPLEAPAGTALYDAINKALDILADADEAAATAVVVLTDGADNASDIPLNQLAANVDAADVPLFGIAVGDDPANAVIEQLSTASGGQYETTLDPAQLGSIYGDIENRLKNEYLLEYHSAVGDCEEHTVEVVVETPDGPLTYSSPMTRCFAEIKDPTAQSPSPRRSSNGGGSLGGSELLLAALALGLLRRRAA